MKILNNFFHGFIDGIKSTKNKNESIELTVKTKLTTVNEPTLPKDLKQTNLLGVLLRNARENKKLKQYQVASMIGISNNTLSRYENNTTFPNKTILDKLSNLYGISTYYISTIAGSFVYLYENNKLILTRKFKSPYATKAADNGYFIVADFDYPNKQNYFYIYNKYGKVITKKIFKSGPINIDIIKNGSYTIYELPTGETFKIDIK